MQFTYQIVATNYKSLFFNSLGYLVYNTEFRINCEADESVSQNATEDVAFAAPPRTNLGKKGPFDPELGEPLSI